MEQTRWLCLSCAREWVHVWRVLTPEGLAVAWDETFCPLCRSAEITQRTFTPSFPGGDIPREQVSVPSESVDPYESQLMAMLGAS